MNFELLNKDKEKTGAKDKEEVPNCSCWICSSLRTTPEPIEEAVELHPPGVVISK